MPMTRMMKDSGVEWIGEIPENWKLRKMKRCIASRVSGDWGDEKKNNENDIICLRIADFDYKTFSFKDLPNEEYTVRNYNKEVIKKLLLEHDDILIEKSGGGDKTPVGRCVVFNKKINALYANFMDRIRVTADVCPIYFSYILNCFYLNRYTLNYIKQTIGIQNLDITSMLACEYAPFQSISEQQKIAEFLDEKCGAIDEIIRKTEQSIEEYKKLKQSVITKAVTKGIRPNRPMQDSNIEWIGEIPTDWEIKKFRNILKERTEKNVPIKSTERLSLSIDLGVTLYAEKTTNLDRFKDDFEQYKIAHEGDLVMNSMNMIIGAVGVSKYYGCVSPVYYTWYDETPNHTTAKYCEYLLRCKTIKKVLFALGRGIYAIERGDDRVNTCRLKISRDDLKNLKLPLPSLDEQAEIINYLDEKCAEIDILVEKKQQFLAEMANYKKSLIYEYVTGKKEVA